MIERVSPPRILGILPALGGSLHDLARHGQAQRFLRYYLPAYLEHWPRVRLFSYEPESVAEFTDDPELRERVEVVAVAAVGSRFARAARLAGQRRARRALRECDLVRVMQAPGALPALLAGAPYVCTYGYDYASFSETGLPGGNMMLSLKRPALRGLLRVLLRRAQAVIVTSVQGEEQARALGARHLLRVPNGVDTDVFRPGGGPRDVDIAFVGRFVPQKDLGTLIRAAAELQPRPRLVLAGDGPLRPQIEQLAREHDVDAEFPGALDNVAVAELLRRCRVFALPSHLEGHPKALLEAMAAGLPAVGSDIPGIRELAADGAVITHPPGDVEALRAALGHLLGDEAAAAALAARGRQLAAERFSLHALLRREVSELAAVAEGVSAARANAAPRSHHRKT